MPEPFSASAALLGTVLPAARLHGRACVSFSRLPAQCSIARSIYFTHIKKVDCFFRHEAEEKHGGSGRGEGQRGQGMPAQDSHQRFALLIETNLIYSLPCLTRMTLFHVSAYWMRICSLHSIWMSGFSAFSRG
eukprot:5045876-Pleurochrysis_carterae.AAC.2